jgi:hypothetical protein
MALTIVGNRIVENHFEIVFENNTLMIKNLNLNCEESCGLYKRIFEDELYCLRPGNAFRIGTLEFLVERYSTGIVTDIGQ